MKQHIKYFSLILTLLMGACNLSIAQDKPKKILVIGIDGIINTALDYATTPGVDQLLKEASFSMNGYGGAPAYATTGWSTMLTGVGAQKHGVITNKTFAGNKFDAFPSVVNRIQSANKVGKVASIVRHEGINTQLNSAADYKFQFNTDQAVYDKSAEMLKQADMGAVFVQFSSPAEVGEAVGYQLREAQYVLAIQQVDKYVEQLYGDIQSRATYDTENWAVYVVSTHGGTESGISMSNTIEEFNVPIIFSGGGLDRKELIGTSMAARENSDNVLTINKAASKEISYVRVPIGNTALKGMNKFTIEFWVKAGVNSSDPALMGDKDWGSGGNPGFVICRSGTGWKINIANVKRERIDLNSTKPLEDGNWHHMGITFDKTKECILYMDGEKVGEMKLTYKAEDDMSTTMDYFCLAQDGSQKYSDGGPNWAGSMNEVRIWNDVLSGETLKNYMHLRNIEKSAHPNLSALNLYLKLDEARGTAIQDWSGKGNHGELVGPAAVRYPLYAVGLNDVAVNILGHLGIQVDGTWGLEGNSLKSNVPYRLFKLK
jgi:hypothetical protein